MGILRLGPQSVECDITSPMFVLLGLTESPSILGLKSSELARLLRYLDAFKGVVSPALLIGDLVQVQFQHGCTREQNLREDQILPIFPISEVKPYFDLKEIGYLYSYASSIQSPTTTIAGK